MVRARAGPPRPGARRGNGADAAVSPVIGMVLILAISVLGIVAVTNWGLPAILAMQQNVEQRTVLNDFNALDASLQKLIAGTTGQTTFKWQPAIGTGAVDIDPTGHRWLLAVDVADVVVEYGSFADADNALRINASGAGLPASVRVQAHTWKGGVAREVILANNSGDCSTSAWTGNLAGDRTYYLKTNQSSGCTAVNLENVVLSLSVRSPQGGAVTVYHDAFLVDVGHVHWDSIRGTPSRRHIYHSNGAVFSGTPGSYLLDSSLPLAPPREFTNANGASSVGVFARLLKVNGTASFSGVDAGARNAVFLDFVGTYTLASHDNVSRVSVYVHGPLQEGVYAELQSRAYNFTARTGPGGDPYVRYEETQRVFRFSSAYTLVEVER